eukprot:6476354-Amphidinium_carterae.1
MCEPDFWMRAGGSEASGMELASLACFRLLGWCTLYACSDVQVVLESEGVGYQVVDGLHPVQTQHVTCRYTLVGSRVVVVSTLAGLGDFVRERGGARALKGPISQVATRQWLRSASPRAAKEAVDA